MWPLIAKLQEGRGERMETAWETSLEVVGTTMHDGERAASCEEK